MRLDEHLEELEQGIDQFEMTHTAISEKQIGWHIDHSFRVILAMEIALRQSNPEEYRPKSSLARSILFRRGKIKRGTANAPKLVMSKRKIKSENLQTMAKLAKDAIRDMQDCNPHCFANHPNVGVLKRDDAMRFIEIHTAHHLDIIRDIMSHAQESNTEERRA